MVKKKSGKKKQDDEWDDDALERKLMEANITPGASNGKSRDIETPDAPGTVLAPKRKKKDTGGFNGKESEPRDTFGATGHSDSDSADTSAPTQPTTKSKKKTKTKKKPVFVDSESEEEEAPVTPKGGGKKTSPKEEPAAKDPTPGKKGEKVKPAGDANQDSSRGPSKGTKKKKKNVASDESDLDGESDNAGASLTAKRKNKGVMSGRKGKKTGFVPDDDSGESEVSDVTEAPKSRGKAKKRGTPTKSDSRGFHTDSTGSPEPKEGSDKANKKEKGIAGADEASQSHIDSKGSKPGGASVALPDPGAIRIKSKKEKEREKKERLKAEGPEAAAKRKPSAKAGSSEPDNESEIHSEKPSDEQVRGGSRNKQKGPSEAQLQSLREKQELQRQRGERREQKKEEKRRPEEKATLSRTEERPKAAEPPTERKRAVPGSKKKASGKAEAKRLAQVERLFAPGTGFQLRAPQSQQVNTKKKRQPRSEQEDPADTLESKGVDGTAEGVETERTAPPGEPPAAARSNTDEQEIDHVAQQEGEDDSDILEDWEEALDSEKHGDSNSDNSDDDKREKPKETRSCKGSATSPVPTREGQAKTQRKAPRTLNESSASEDSSEEESGDLTSAQKAALRKKEEAAEKRKQRIADAQAAKSKDNLRSPICCILGHVDTGKTKLLDRVRKTNVQEGEAGGITQQIGATYFPVDAIKAKTSELTSRLGAKHGTYNLPGLLIIDTPGHESFTNLRSRGSSLCNIAILVIDIMHGMEPQTIESIELLRKRKTPFIVALNKIDRIYNWKSVQDNPVQMSLKLQGRNQKLEFQERVNQAIQALAEQGLNACLYWENKSITKYVSLVPTSAITGEGIPDMLHLLMMLTQTKMAEKLMYISELECTVLEVKVIDGLGTTIDVVLSNGVIHEGDRIVICGLDGPIVTNVRALLTPQPLKELRIKSAYVQHKEIKAAMGIKIAANGLDRALAGSRLLVCGPLDDLEELKDEVMQDLRGLMKAIDRSGRGVSVQASTLGSMEALLSFLKDSKIPVSSINIGPVHKKDITKASVMLEHVREYAVLLAFDVKIHKEAQDLADELGVKVFKADIIYHLFDQFTAFRNEVQEQKRRDQATEAVFPCHLRIVPGAVFNRSNPILVGVDVVDGVLRVGTPLCTVNAEGEIVRLGKVATVEKDHKPVDGVRRQASGGGVAIKIETPSHLGPRMVGRHFSEKDDLYSHITRASIDVLKETFKEDLIKEDWALVIRLKRILQVT